MLTITEAAHALSVNPKTLRAWCDKGLVPHTRLPSGYRRFSEAQMIQIRQRMERTP
jgi:DNA-binding transcriptional MerR regulator